MKKEAIIVLFAATLILGIFHPQILKTTADDFQLTPALPENISREPMPENFTTTNYLNTTNPYSDEDVSALTAAGDAVAAREGSNPIYVLIAGDEEERAKTYNLGSCIFSWRGYAWLQTERGDEALAANFGIDIRVIGYVEWDSDDSLNSMVFLWRDLEAKTSQYLRTLYHGEYWTDYVDAIIGITAQATPGDPKPIAGLAPSPTYLDQGRTVILLRWQTYWADDNLVQHEVSHLFYATDHTTTPDPCCAMASHSHFQTFIYEDGRFWPVFDYVDCPYTAYSWCTNSTWNCKDTIDNHRSHYENEDYSAVYLFYWYDPYFNKPMTCYWYYDEDSEKAWREVMSGPAQATVR